MHDLVVGLDLGQAADYSALAALERAVQVESTGRSPLYLCRALKRWPLGTPYPAIVSAVAEFLRKCIKIRTALVVDATGVGRPVVDQLLQVGVPAVMAPVTITAGRRAKETNDGWCVPKKLIIGNLRKLLQERRLRFSGALPEATTLLRELHQQRVIVRSARHEAFGTLNKEHDDLVLALALAAWWAECQPRRPAPSRE